MADKDTLTEAKEAYQTASEAEAKNHENWLDDFRFARLNEQWPENVKRQRELESRPCLTINRLPSFIRQVTNDARQNRPAIKTHPVADGADQETSEILNGLIRNIEYTSNADVAYDTALDHAVTGGFGYFRINVDYADNDVFDKDIKIERIANPLTVLGDEESTCADSSDWNKAFVTDMWKKDAFKRKWPGAEMSDFSSEGRDQKDELWFQDDMVRVAEYWTRSEVPAKLLKLTDGTVMYEEQYLEIQELLAAANIFVVGDRDTKTQKVMQRILSGAEVLETNKWAGRYIPIIPVYGDEVIVEGERHWISLVRFAKDPQRMFNYWRTASTELVALAPKMPFIGPKGAFNTDAAKWQTANTQTHSYIEYDGPQPPQRQPFAGPPAGALQEAMNAADDMKSIMGLFNASLGEKSNETSGRAILARQREGDTSTFNFIDNLSRGLRHAGRVIVDMIPRVYSEERIIRVIKEDGTNQQVQIKPGAPPQPQNNPEDDAGNQVQAIARIYDVTTGKYDVTCEVGPSFTTKREEAAAQMTEFVRAFPQAAPLIGDLLAKNLDWPGADDIAKRLKLMLPPQILGQNPQVQQLQQQMQQMDQMAKQAVGQLQQQLQQLAKQLQDAKTDKEIEMVKARIDAFNAETNRMKALNEARVDGLQLQQDALNAAMSSQIVTEQPPVM